MDDIQPTETPIVEPYGINNLGPVKTGDVLIIRYREGLQPSQQRMYYDSLRAFFRDRGIHPRIIGVIGQDVSLDKVDDVTMARYGWKKVSNGAA